METPTSAATTVVREPSCVHTVELDPPAPDGLGDAHTWTSTGGELWLGFRDLFLRESGEGDGDIVIEM